MPWFFYLVAGTVRTFADRSRKEAADRLQYLVIVWFAVTLIFFSLLRSSIPSYILPAYPAVALITGAFLSRHIGKGERSPAFVVPSVLSIVTIAALAGGLFYYRGYAGRHAIYQFLAPTILAAAVILSVLCVAALASLVLRRPGWLAAVMAMVFPGLLVLFLHVVPEIEQHLHWRVKGKHLAETILEVEEPGDTIVMVKQYYPDIPFYLRRPVPRLHVGTPGDFPFKEHDPGYGELVLFGDEAEKALMTSEKRFLLVAPKREYERMQAVYPDALHLVEEVNRHVLFFNRPVQSNTGNSRGSEL
jgi:hypothetical protein